jgi:hypothetical protein
MSNSMLRVAVVGACASGKSTLVGALRQAGYDARHVAQEHSYVPSMWQQVCRPDVLIYLDVTYETVIARRPLPHLRPEDLAEQKRRLAHAQDHCDLCLDSSKMGAEEVKTLALAYLAKIQSKWQP